MMVEFLSMLEFRMKEFIIVELIMDEFIDLLSVWDELIKIELFTVVLKGNDPELFTVKYRDLFTNELDIDELITVESINEVLYKVEFIVMLCKIVELMMAD